MVKGFAPPGAVPLPIKLVGDGPQGPPVGLEQSGQLGGLPVVDVGLGVGWPSYSSKGAKLL